MDKTKELELQIKIMANTIDTQEKIITELSSEKFSLQDRSKVIDLLDAYSHFLEEHGYTDNDWQVEEPFAIDEFLKDKRLQSFIKKNVKIFYHCPCEENGMISFADCPQKNKPDCFPIKKAEITWVDFDKVIATSEIVNNIASDSIRKIANNCFSLAQQMCEAKANDLVLEHARVVVFEIDFAGNVKARVEIKNNKLSITDAMNGYGDRIDESKIIITPFTY